MQFEVDPMHLTQKNGQKPNFWLFGSFKKAFLWFLNDPVWAIWEYESPLVKIIYYNHNMQFKVDRMLLTQGNGQKPHFWLFGLFKKAFLWFLNDPPWLIWWPHDAHHVVLSKYAMSSRSDDPNSRNWQKASFLAILIIQKGIFPIFEWSRMINKIVKSCTPFSYIII